MVHGFGYDSIFLKWDWKKEGEIGRQPSHLVKMGSLHSKSCNLFIGGEGIRFDKNLIFPSWSKKQILKKFFAAVGHYSYS